MKIQNIRIKTDLEIGIDSLCTNKELVIWPADKGGGVVILDKKMYKIVGDCDKYTHLLSDPGNKYKGELERMVTKDFKHNI